MKKPREFSAFFDGISDFPKTGGTATSQYGFPTEPASYRFGQSIDHRTDIRSVKLQPRTIKESGTVVQALPKWGITPPTSGNNTYIYDEGGNIYQRTEAGAYSLLRTIAASHGNGIQWWGEDNFLYYTSDSLIGRYGPIDTANPTFTDNFFGSQGGTRTNTNSLELLSASSQYASRASSGILQVAGDLTISAQIYPYSLPTVGNSMTIVSKWDENGNKRSYKFDISPTSNYFGNGSDGALTISTNTTDSPIDSACTGSSGTNTLTATNVSFVAGQIILIHQTQGTGAGTWMRTSIQSYTAGTITTVDPLNADYVTGAQVLVLKQYTNVTVNTGITWTVKAWNGTTGGILAFIANGIFSGPGQIYGTGKGFRGGSHNGYNNDSYGYQGESPVGVGGTSGYANGGGGGGGQSSANNSPIHGGGGGGGYGSVGITGTNTNGNSAQQMYGGAGGYINGSNDLTTVNLGSGGGAGGSGVNSDDRGADGGNGGAIVFISAITYSFTGYIMVNGTDGLQNSEGDGGGAGAGSGGAVFIKAQVATLGSNLITATGGVGSLEGRFGIDPVNGAGGNGGYGRIHIDYLTSYTGTTTPTLDYVQDPNLGSSNGQTLRLQISNNGTAVETYSKLVDLTVNTWQQIACVWTASTSTGEFFLNGVSQGTQTGALTQINANTSTFQVGMYKNATVPAGFYNGLIDEVQVYGVTHTAEWFLLSLAQEVMTTTTGLYAYYMFNSVATDSTSYANDLTLYNSPAYSTNTPFAGATTRVDIDTSYAAAGQTYTVPVAISETTANKMIFTPVNDPQKSIAVTVAAIGTGNWTLTVHDSFNNVVASMTVLNAQMSTGLYEFIFSTPWRVVIGNNYHFHLTSTVADGTVTTGTTADLSTVNYKSYYAFLVEDTQFHPVANMLNFVAFGNERYIGTLRGTTYDPNEIALPAGWRVRCFAYWNEYLAIGVWRGNSVEQFDQGRIFFWDGISLTYNFYIDVPEGAINAMMGSKGRLFFISGSRARLMVYEGASTARKLKNLLNVDSDVVVDVYPGAMSMWRQLLRFGVDGSTGTPDIPQGVYTWGTQNDKYPESLSFDYIASTGNSTGSNIRIGMVTTVFNQLLIGWQDNVSSGVDYVDVENPVYPTGTLQLLIQDEDAMYHEKQAITVTTQFEPLVSGQSIALMYRLNRGSWVTFPAITTVDSTTDRHVIALNSSRYREYEIGVNLATTTGVSPVMLAVSIEPEELEREQRIG
jgi:hypothetical protein